MSSALSNESVLATHTDPQAKPETAEHGNRGIPRWADVIIAGISLVVAGPVIGALGVAIALTSGTPVFFRQRRVGRGFQPFTMIKLRTMKPSDGGLKVTRKGDERVTRLGWFLRGTKLDELPALWNVVRGDMALVGPRPEVPEYVDVIDARWQVVLSVRPGLTDPVTVSLRNEEELLGSAGDNVEAYYVSELQPAKLKGYVEYLQTRTLRGDIRILGRTLTAVVRR